MNRRFQKNSTMRTIWWCSLLIACCCAVVFLGEAASWFRNVKYCSTDALVKWSIAQWLPEDDLISSWQTQAWQHWDNNQQEAAASGAFNTTILEIPVIDVQKEWENPLQYLEDNYGKDWRKHPLLLKHLWSKSDLESSQRRLSLTGLLQENMSIPYFYDSRIPLNLSPDAHGPIRKIVRNMTTRHAPHKIGSQLFVQRYPELIREVAPTEFVSNLFGNYFSPHNILGSGPLGMFPGLTTVPLFVAFSRRISQQQQQQQEQSQQQQILTKSQRMECSMGQLTEHKEQNGMEVENEEACYQTSSSSSSSSTARTDLHCEPIGNVAVQLEGQKHWTLVSPEHSFRLRPRLAPDGRAFFASWSTDFSHVPQYQAITRAGDAMWVPTWTWHRVDYVIAEEDEGNSNDVAIGASLFHFRVLDFWKNHPLFALLILPSLFKELIGYNTQ